MSPTGELSMFIAAAVPSRIEESTGRPGRSTMPPQVEQRGHLDRSRVPTAALTVTLNGTMQSQTACRFSTPAADPSAIGDILGGRLQSRKPGRSSS